MDLRQLSTFRAVFELGSLSKASDLLRIAQPALSRQMRALEHELKNPLFVRHGRGMVPTEAGQLLYERTTGLTRALEQARDDVTASGLQPTGRVVVGMVPTISGALAGIVAQRVVTELPQVELRMVDAYGNFLIDWLHRGEIDFAIVYGPAAHLHFQTEMLRSDELFVVGAKGSGFSRDTPMTLAALQDRFFVLPSPSHGLRSVVDQACRAEKVQFKIRVEADSYQALVDIVGVGVGLTFLPYHAIADRVAAGLLEAAPLSPALTRQLALSYPARHRASRATQAVIEIVRREAAWLGAPPIEDDER